VLQPVGSFKMRGIYNAIAALPPEERAKGISTVSSGNTAQAISWAARRFGVPARAIMPETAPQQKIRATEEYGGTPVLLPREEAFRFLFDGGYHEFEDAFIHPVANRDVIAGHATMGLEIFEDLPDVDTVFVPVGGGGLISGTAVALKQLRPSVRIVGVEPSGCIPVIAGLAAGEPVIVDYDTFCDGVAVSFMMPEMYPLLRDLVDEMVTVDEDAVFATIRSLALKNKIVAEGAGALAVAAALNAGPAAGSAVAVISGGSIDGVALAKILAG
jgi:threonine dehydratase